MCDVREHTEGYAWKGMWMAGSEFRVRARSHNRMEHTTNMDMGWTVL